MGRRDHVTLAAVVVWTVGGLWIESRVGLTGQMLLGALTCGVLLGLLALHTAAVRLQTLLVVCVATSAEIVGSLIWGLYTYRLENLPTFVPPGHGLVYLGGLALARTVGRRGDWLVATGAICVAAWGLLGVTVLPAPDASGAIGCCTLALVLVVTRRPVYAGVFLVVAGLELYGTALGTWTWESAVPGLGLSQGNPPSGVASGYVLFDVVALAVAPRLTRVLRRLASVAPTRRLDVGSRLASSRSATSGPSARLNLLRADSRSSVIAAMTSTSRTSDSGTVRVLDARER